MTRTKYADSDRMFEACDVKSCGIVLVVLELVVISETVCVAQV